MKQVTIENVKARIAELEGADQLIGLGLHAEFELACLRQLLASLEAEPVAMRWRYLPDGIHGMGEWNYRDQGYIDTLNAYHLSRQKELLYTAPPAPVSMKDHQIRELVNELRDIAVEYHGTQQLRERIARTIRAAMLQGAEPAQATDNTAQQFEALAGSQTEDDMICYGERCKVCDEMIIGRSIDGLCVCCRDDLKSDPETVRGRDI